MTLKEIREKIAKASNSEWLNSRKATFDYQRINRITTLEGLSSIYEYVTQQITGLSDLGNVLPGALNTSKQVFTTLEKNVKALVDSSVADANYNGQNYWNRHIQPHIDRSKNDILPFDSPEVSFLLKLYKEDPEVYEGAYQFLTGSFRANNKKSFIGTILAFEFMEKGKLGLTKRVKSERASITRIVNEFGKRLSKAEVQLVEHLKTSSEKVERSAKEIDTLKVAKETLFDKWFKQVKTEFTSFNEGSHKRVSELENTYESLLSLKKPTEYWSLRAQKLKKEGWKATTWLIILIIAAAGSLYSLLYFTPDSMLASFTTDKAGAIRWSIIYIMFISFLAYGIRILQKVSFSSFHLARDAEEREQLTYVYLALAKESDIPSDERNLIMQSLFSRADTGLLKDDSSPTMPNDFVGKILGGK